MKKLLNHFVFLYAVWLTFMLFTKGDTKLAAKFVLVSFIYAFVVAVVPYIFKEGYNYYKKRKEDKN